MWILETLETIGTRHASREIEARMHSAQQLCLYILSATAIVNVGGQASINIHSRDEVS